MQLFHCSQTEINKIDQSGRFGEFLFFASSPAHYGEFIYKIDIDESDVIDCHTLFSRGDPARLRNIVARVMKITGCDEVVAREYLTQSKRHSNTKTDWDLQGLTALCGQMLGYRCTAMPCGLYMIAMAGKEHELTLWMKNTSKLRLNIFPAGSASLA
jgi:hypothetical protein